MRWAIVVGLVAALCLAFGADPAAGQPASPSPAPTQPPSPSPTPTPDLKAAAVERLFTSDRLMPEWFVPGYLNAIRRFRLQQAIAVLKRNYGSFQKVQPEGGLYMVVLARGVVPVRATFDTEGRFETVDMLPARHSLLPVPAARPAV